MKIVTWNCNGALRKKTQEIDSLDADILVIQECEDPARSTIQYKEWAGEYLWVGSSKNKGIGVFARKGNRISNLEWNGSFKISGLSSSSTSLNWDTRDLELFLPCKVNDRYNLLAVWTKSANSPNFGYMGQFWKYLQIHHNNLAQPDTIILGDFNSNCIWDQNDRWWSHSDVINELKQIRIESLYHFNTGEQQGKETSPTFYLNRNLEKPYHIDYVFLSENILNNGSLEVGETNAWISISDHLPLSLVLKNQ